MEKICSDRTKRQHCAGLACGMRVNTQTLVSLWAKDEQAARDQHPPAHSDTQVHRVECLVSGYTLPLLWGGLYISQTPANHRVNNLRPGSWKENCVETTQFNAIHGFLDCWLLTRDLTQNIVFVCLCKCWFAQTPSYPGCKHTHVLQTSLDKSGIWILTVNHRHKDSDAHAYNETSR